MLSAFNTKFKALQGKVPQSTMNTPWKRTLLLVVFLVGTIAVFLFIAIFGLLRVIFEESGKSSDFSTLAEDERTQAEIDARAAMEGWLSSDPRVAASLNAAEYFADDDGQWR